VHLSKYAAFSEILDSEKVIIVSLTDIYPTLVPRFFSTL